MKFVPNFHRQWNFWILPDFKCLQVREVQESEIRGEFTSREHFQNFARFRGQKCEICAKFSSAVEFLDFAGYQVITAPGKVQECEIWAEFSSRVHFFDFAQFWVKNVKFEPNFHRLWNFWIFPDFKCLQVREVQECEIREEFSSRVHFLDFAQFWGQKCEIWAKFSSPG